TRSKRDWSSDVCSSDLIKAVWPVQKILLKKRYEITPEQSGRQQYDNPNDAYYLFKLGYPLKLQYPIHNIPDSFMASIKMATLERSEERRVGIECRSKGR